jgi:hypothetical protein
MLDNDLANMKRLRATPALGQIVKPGFDISGTTNSEHDGDSTAMRIKQSRQPAVGTTNAA